MPKPAMGDVLKRRMAATQQASEIQLGNEAYEALFQTPLAPSKAVIADLPFEKLKSFFTADIGFKPYPKAKLEAFSQQLAAEGLFERIIVRAIPESDCYEIIAGHNRTEAARLAGWKTIAAEIIEADDDRAIAIAISTNLMRRQDLSIMERGKAYKALLEAQRRQGCRTDLQTSGENRQKFLTREIVAEFFGVTEYEIRKAVKLTQLIPELQDILENEPKRLNLTCADMIADYNADAQTAFIEICTIDGYRLNKSAMKHIVSNCPPPNAKRQQINAAWREARAEESRRLSAPPKKITFDRKKFAPYLDKLGSGKKLEELFLEFLRERVG